LTTERRWGQGLAFPLRINGNGELGRSDGAENVRQSIQLILLTDRQERVLRPDFGAGLRAMLYEPNTATTRRIIQERITRSLNRWERRINLQAVHVEADPSDPQGVICTISYQLKGSTDPQSVSLNLNLATSAKGV